MTATVRIDVSDILVILGILRRTSPAAAELDPTWFEDPLTGLARALVDERRLDQLTELLGALFGETPAATAEQAALAGSERWHPVFADPGGDAQTGVTLGLVTDRVGATTSVAAGALVDIPTGTVRTQVSAVLPLFHGTAVGTAAPTFTGSADPIRVALRVGPLGGAAVAIDQISLVARIPRSTTGAATFRLGLAGVAVAGQRIDDLDIDLAQPPDDVAGRLVGLALQVAEAGAGSPVLSSLLDVLGLGHRAGVPDLALDDLLGDGPELAFAAWLRLLLAPGSTAQADPLRAWLETLAELLGRVLDPTATPPTVATSTEDGATVHRLPIGSAVRIEVRRRATPTGSEVVLGLALLADRGTSGRGSIGLQLARFDLDPAGAVRGIRPIGTVRAAVEVGSANGRLVPAGTLAGGQAFGLDSVEIGLRVDAEQARPVVELHGLTVAGTPYARLDLSSPDAIAAAGGSLIGDVVTAVGDALGVGSQAQALAVLLGLRPPDGAVSWPDLLGPTLFAAPLDAIAGFYAAALADPAVFALLLAHLPVVLDQRTEPDAGTVSGVGTGPAPWRVPLFDDALGTVALTAFVADHGPLVVGLDADLSPITAGEVTLASTVGAELLALTLPAGGTGAAAALAPAVHARLGAAIAGTIQVGPAILGPVQLEVRARFDAAERTLAGGLTLALDTAEVHGVRVAVAPVRLAAGEDAGVALWSAVPWTAVELLAGALLCDRSPGGDGPLAAVAGLLGWAPWLADRPITLDTGAATVTVPVPLGRFPMLRLDELARSPSEALASWVRRLVGDEAEPPLAWGVPFLPRPAGPDDDPDLDTEGPELEVVDLILAQPVRRDLAFEVAALLAALLPSGSTAPTGWRCRLRGAGTRADPWTVPLAAATDAALVELWLDRDAPPALPSAVTDALTASPPTGGSLTDHLAGQLRLAAAFLGVGGWLGDESTLPTRLAATAQAATGTDGVLRPSVGSAQSIVAGHHHVPAHLDDVSAALAVPLVPADTVVVRAPLPGQRGPRLAGVELAAEIDLAGGLPDLTTLGATGPWAAVLPDPDAGVDGSFLLRELLGRVAAARPAAAGLLEVVAIGSAAAAARAGTTGLGIGRLVTVAAPITGTAAGVPTGLGLLVELRRAVDDLSGLAGATPPPLGALGEIEYSAALLPGGWVPAGDGRLHYRPFPSGWYAPAAPAAGETEVSARLDRAAVDAGMTRLVQAVVAAGFGARAGGLDRHADGLHLGARLRVAGSGGSPSIAASARMELASLALAGPVQDAGWPRVEVSSRLWRDDGPLLAPAGGAGLLVGDAEVRAVVDTWDGTVNLALLARRVEVLGVRVPTMVVGGGQGGPELVRLAPEERIVVSAVLELLGNALPAAGQAPASPLAALAALAEDLGLLVREPTGVSAPAEPIERLLSDPAGELEALLNEAPARARMMARLAGLAGLAATINADASLVTVLAGPLAVTVDAGAAPEIRLGFATLLGQLAVRGAVALDGRGRVRTSVEALPGAGAGTPVTTVGLGPLPAVAPPWPVLRLGFDAAAIRPVTAEIVVPAGLPGAGTTVSYPDDPGAVVEALGWALLGELASAALAAALEAQPARLTPLLTALGLMRGTRVVNPLPFVLDPLGWLDRPDVLGATAPAGALDLTKVGTLVQAAATLLGATGGVAALPGQATLALVSTGTTPGAELRWNLGVARVAVDVRRRSGEWRVGFDAVGVLTVTAGGAVPIRTVRILGTVDGGGPALTVELVTASGAALPLGLLPPQPLANLPALAGAAATVLVPAVLDALAALAPTAPAPATAPEFVGTAVAILGDALALRTGTPPAFDATRLQALATDPVGYLNANLQPVRLVQALGPAARAVFPAAVSTSGTTTTIQVAPLRIDLVPGGSDVDATVTVMVPVPAASPAVTVTGTVTLNSGSGLQDAELAVAFVGELLSIGEVTLHPTVTVGVEAVAGGFVARAELDLPVEPPGTDRHRLVLAMATSATGSPPTASLTCRHGAVVDPKPDACLVEAAKNIVLPLLIDLVLDSQAVQDWLAGNGAGTQPRAEPLTPGLLERQNNRYRRRTDALDDDKVLAHLLQAAAKVASRLNNKTRELGRHAQISVGSEGVNWSGIKASLTGRILLGATEAWSIELGTDPFLAPHQASVTVLAVKIDPASVEPYSLALGVRSAGIGLRVDGPEGKPLRAEPPVRLGALGLYGSAGPQWSVALVAEGLAIDLGSAAGGGPGVAKGLLAPGGAAAAGDGTPAAPGVDVRLAITSRGPALAVAGRDAFPVWGPIHRALGPLRVEQIGVDIVPRPAPNTTVDLKSMSVGVLVDASLAVGPLSAVVDDLRLLVPVKDPRPKNWSIDVAGFAVGFDNQAVTLTGALRKPTGAGGDYVGLLSLRAGTIGLGLFGGYGQYGEGADRYTSLFVFGVLKAPFGGPPAFFLTGIGAGVGINRGLSPPPAGAIEQSLFLRQLDRGIPVGADTLTTLASTFPPRRGAYWFAAGVSFTSFVFIQAVAVLTVDFDPTGFDIALLGLARFQLPPAGPPVVTIEVAVDGRFSSRTRALTVLANFTANSWLVDPSCRITGGIAMGLWFDDGDFVVSLGGYHPDFRVPARYPIPKRLALDWQATENAHLAAAGYVALTPQAVMTGARGEASIQLDWCGASATIGFDAIVFWDPLHYRFDLHVDVTGWVLIGDAQVSLTVGADVRVEGPPLEIDVAVRFAGIAIPLHLGTAGAGRRQPLAWVQLRDRYLTGGGGNPHVDVVLVRGGLPVDGRDGSRVSPLAVTPAFALVTRTALPARRFVGDSVGGSADGSATPDTDRLGVPALWVSSYEATHTVRLVRVDGTSETPVAGPGLRIRPRLEHQPAATWGAFPYLDLVGGKVSGGPVTVRTVAGGSVIADRDSSQGRRGASSRQLEQPTQRPLPLAFVDAPDLPPVVVLDRPPILLLGAVGRHAYVADLVQRPRTSGLDVAVQSAQPVIAEPAPTPTTPAPPPSPTPLAVVGLRRPPTSAAAVATTVEAQAVRIPAPSTAAVQAAARRWSVLLKLPAAAGGPADDPAAGAASGRAAAERRWLAGTAEAPPAHLAGSLDEGATVPLTDLTAWRADGPGRFSWRSERPCRVVLLDGDGVLRADTLDHTGTVDVAGGGSTVAVAPGALLMAPFLAVWVTARPVLWIDAFLGLVPGGVLAAPLVGGVAGVAPARADGSPVTLATGARAAGSVGVVLPAGAGPEPAGVRLAVSGASLAAVEPVTTQGVDGRWVALWDLQGPRLGGTSVSITGRDNVDVVFIADRPVADLVDLIGAVTVEAAAEAVPTGSDGTAEVRWTPGDAR